MAVSIHLVGLYNRADAAFALGMMGLVQALPIMLLAIAGGQLADRFDRRRVMMLTFALPVVSAAGLLAVALFDGSVLWIYLLLGIGAVGWALGNPARQALLPQLVPAELFSNAVAWNSSVFYIASVTGPVVGGIVVAMSSNLAPAFALVLVCRVIAVAAIALIRHRPASRLEQSISWESVVAGIRFVWNTKLILATITLDLFAVLLGGATYLLPIYADILHVGASGLGFLQSADAVGAICMAMLLAHRPPAATRRRHAALGRRRLRRGHDHLRPLAMVLALAADDVPGRRAGQHQRRGAPHARADAHARRNARTRLGRQRRVHRGQQRSRRPGIGADGLALRPGDLGRRRRGGHDPRRAGRDAALAANPPHRVAGRHPARRRGRTVARLVTVSTVDVAFSRELTARRNVREFPHSPAGSC